MPADIDGFRQLCDEHKLILIEDAACAIGSEYKGKKIGSHSDLVCFSFHPRKVITTGDGGMITTSREELYERLKRLRQHSMSVNDQVRHQSDKIIFEDYLELGYNYRMTDIQAAIGIEQLKKLDWIISERRKIARTYINAFKNINCIDLPIESPDVCSNYQSFSIMIKGNSPICRNDLMQKITDEGISTRRGIMTAHRQTVYSYRNEKLPISEALSDNSLLIPLYVPMKAEEINKVISVICDLLMP